MSNIDPPRMQPPVHQEALRHYADAIREVWGDFADWDIVVQAQHAADGLDELADLIPAGDKP